MSKHLPPLEAVMCAHFNGVLMLMRWEYEKNDTSSCFSLQSHNHSFAKKKSPLSTLQLHELNIGSQHFSKWHGLKERYLIDREFKKKSNTQLNSCFNLRVSEIVRVSSKDDRSGLSKSSLIEYVESTRKNNFTDITTEPVKLFMMLSRLIENTFHTVAVSNFQSQPKVAIDIFSNFIKKSRQQCLTRENRLDFYSIEFLILLLDYIRVLYFHTFSVSARELQ